MAVSALQVTEEALAYALVTDKNGLERLLKRNGVVIGNNASDKEVSVAVLMASAKSPNFKNELATFLTSKVKEAGETLSFVGTSQDFGFTGIDDFQFTGSRTISLAGGPRQAAARQRAAARALQRNNQE
jgi:hypothetical protein